MFNNFKDNDKYLKYYYWLSIIGLFVLLGAGCLWGLTELFTGRWIGLFIIAGSIFLFFVMYVALMVIIGFLVDVKSIRNKMYDRTNEDLYDEEEDK